MSNKLKYLIFVLIIFQFTLLNGFAQGSRKTNTTSVTRNSYAPELYAENLDFRTMLVNLPGAKTSGSNWQVSYQIYFVPESDFDNSIPKIRSREPAPQDFSQKILLASGSFNKNPISEISQRVIEKNAIIFSSKIPNNSKTAFAKIIVFYSAKIYDAKLKQNIYSSSLFITPPFASNGSDKEPRRKLFLNFFVNENGKVYTSNEARNKTNLNW